jgi:hypothetical protein
MPRSALAAIYALGASVVALGYLKGTEALRKVLSK